MFIRSCWRFLGHQLVLGFVSWHVWHCWYLRLSIHVNFSFSHFHSPKFTEQNSKLVKLKVHLSTYPKMRRDPESSLSCVHFLKTPWGCILTRRLLFLHPVGPEKVTWSWNSFGQLALFMIASVVALGCQVNLPNLCWILKVRCDYLQYVYW